MMLQNPKRTVLAANRQSKRAVEEILSRAGVKLDGPAAWDVTVHDPRFYDRVLAQGPLGMGESYMDGWWDCPAIDQLIDRLLSKDLPKELRRNWRVGLAVLRARLLNLQTLDRSKEVARAHYDLGNEFFEKMLGPSMVYSCGYWKDADGLDAAQEAKLDLICRKLGLDKADTLLDIGCGWGSLLEFAARKYGCRGVGITISEQQAAYAKKRCSGLPVEILCVDYRSPVVRSRGPFTKVVSVGMFEHVGRKNYREFMQIVSGLLPPHGLLLLHTVARHASAASDVWVDKYIFPNGALPSIADIGIAARKLLVMEDWHNFGADYDKTLMAWDANFEKHVGPGGEKGGQKAGQTGLFGDRRFVRMWRYYLLTFAGSFRTRLRNQLWQIVLSKDGVRGGYASLR